MTLRHWTGVGALVASLAGGCAAPPSSDAKPTTKPALQSVDGPQPQWLAHRGQAGPATGMTPDQLAAQVNVYAKAMQAPTGRANTPAALPADAPAVRSGVRFDTPGAEPISTPVPPTAAPAAVTVVRPAPASSIPASPTPAGPAVENPHVAVLRSAVAAGPLSDLPHEEPESADAQPAATPAWPAGVGSAAVAAPADPVGQRLARRARGNPRDFLAQLDYQLYLMLASDATGAEGSVPQLASTNELPADRRDLMGAVIDGLGNFRSNLRSDPSQTPTQQIRPLENMVAQARAGADLTLTPPVLCTKVRGFGQFDAIRPARLPAGHSGNVIVYGEVGNFRPQQQPDGQWQTQLAEEVTLYAADGRVAWSAKPKPKVDLCQSRRQDFFVYVLAPVPPLLPGRYTLQMTVTDLNANKSIDGSTVVTVGN